MMGGPLPHTADVELGQASRGPGDGKRRTETNSGDIFCLISSGSCDGLKLRSSSTILSSFFWCCRQLDSNLVDVSAPGTTAFFLGVDGLLALDFALTAAAGFGPVASFLAAGAGAAAAATGALSVAPGELALVPAADSSSLSLSSSTMAIFFFFLVAVGAGIAAAAAAAAAAWAWAWAAFSVAASRPLLSFASSSLSLPISSMGIRCKTRLVLSFDDVVLSPTCSSGLNAFRAASFASAIRLGIALSSWLATLLLGSSWSTFL